MEATTQHLFHYVTDDNKTAYDIAQPSLLIPDSKVHEAHLGPVGPRCPHAGPRVGVNSIISTPTPTPTPEVSTPTPTPANLQNINSNSNSDSGGFNSNSNSGKSPEYQLQLQLQLRRFQLQLQFQLRRFQLQFQLQLRSFKSNPNSISNPIKLVQLNYHYPITMWDIVWIKWRYAVDKCHVVPNLDQTGQHWHSQW